MFVTTAELAAYLGIAESASLVHKLSQAEAMIAGYLQTTDLNERDVTEQHRIYYPLDADEVLELRDGPIQVVSSIAQIMNPDNRDEDDDLEVSDLIVKPWSIKRNEGFSKGLYEIVYTAGWNKNAANGDPDQMPFRIREALKGIAGELQQRPNRSMQSERIGDYSYTIATGKGEDDFGLSKYSRNELEYWKKPSL